MHAATYAAFLDELSSIEKDAFMGKDLLMAGKKMGKAVKALPSKANELALKGFARAHSVPGGKHLVNYVTNPNNVQDMAMGLGNMGRFFHG